MAAVGDDCYYYYYSSCVKGSHCLYRHCEEARGNEITCAMWQAGNCFRPNCRFRHMEIKMDRSQIPCYWENQPVGCSKPHCMFKHFKPRPFTFAQTATAGNGSTKAPGSPEEVQQETVSSGHSSPIVPPVIIPMIDSDVESTGTASNVGTPVKSRCRPSSKSPPRSRPLASESVPPRKDCIDGKARMKSRTPPPKCSPSHRAEGSPRSGRCSPSSMQSSPPLSPSRYCHSTTARHRGASPVPGEEGRATSSPVRPKSVTERLGNHGRSAAAASSHPSGKRPSLISLKAIKSDKPEVKVMSLEETLRQRALDSMMRAREQAATTRPKSDSPVEHEEPQVDCRRVVMDSDPEQEEPKCPVQPKKASARVSVRDRLGARVLPKKAAQKTKKKRPAPVTVQEELSDDDDDEFRHSAPNSRRRQLLTASNESDDYSEEEMFTSTVRKRKHVPAVDFEEFSAERVTAPLILKKKTLTPVTGPEELSDEGADAVPPKKKKSIPAAYFEDLSDEPVTTPPRKSPVKKRRLAPIRKPDDSSDDQTVDIPVRKNQSAASEPEDYSAEDEPVRVPVKKRLNQVAPSRVDRKEDPVTITFQREPERLKPVKVTIAQDKPLKKKWAHQGNQGVEQKRQKKKLVTDTSEDSLKPVRLGLLRSTEEDTESPKLKAVKKLKARSGLLKKVVSGSMKESEQLEKPGEDVTAAEGKRVKKLVVLDALEERKRLKKLMADHLLRQPALEKPRRKITLITDQEEKGDGTRSSIPRSPQVLSLEEIRKRKMLKKQAESAESTIDSEKEKKTGASVMSPLETKRHKRQKEARPQPVYDISLFTDRGEANKPKSTTEEPRVLSLEEIRRRKQLKRQEDQHEDTASKVVIRAPAKRAKAEMQIYVPPPRKNAGISSVKAADMSPPRETLMIKKRLGEPLAVKAQKQGEVTASKTQIQRGATAVKAGSGEKPEGGVVVKTFSEIMAEKRKKRQLERQQQQRTESSQQENIASGGEASKKMFRFQPVVFRDSEGDSCSNSPKRVDGFGRTAQNVSAGTVSQNSDQSKPAQPTARFSFSVAKQTDDKIRADSNPTSHSCCLEMSESVRPVSEPSKRKDCLVNPLCRSSMPFIAPLPQSSRSVSSSAATVPTILAGPQSPALTPQQIRATTVFRFSPQSLPQPASSSFMSSSSVQQQSTSDGKAPATRSSHLSTTRLPSETEDDFLLTESDAVTLDDGDQLDDLLMDIDSLLE